MIFALITIIITVDLFMFYNLYFIEGLALETLLSNGVLILGVPLPLWAAILIELACAFVLAVFVAGPCALKLAFSAVDPREHKPVIVQTAIVCSTVGIMCPSLSLIAVFQYNDL